jgi:excisionase family DNA binding protein
MTPAYLSTREVAALLGCSDDTVLHAIGRGDLPAIRYGRLVRIARTDLDAFLVAHAVKTKRRLRMTS